MMLEIDQITQWLRDVGSPKAAEVVAICAVEFEFVDLLPPIRGGQDVEYYNATIHAPGHIFREINDDLSEQADQVESAIKGCAAGLGFEVKYIHWVPAVPPSTLKPIAATVKSPSQAEDQPSLVTGRHDVRLSVNDDPEATSAVLAESNAKMSTARNGGSVYVNGNLRAGDGSSRAGGDVLVEGGPGGPGGSGGDVKMGPGEYRAGDGGLGGKGGGLTIRGGPGGPTKPTSRPVESGDAVAAAHARWLEAGKRASEIAAELSQAGGGYGDPNARIADDRRLRSARYEEEWLFREYYDLDRRQRRFGSHETESDRENTDSLQARGIWREKLNYLLKERASASGV